MSKTCADAKKELRKHCLTMRRNMPDEQKKSASKEIYNKLLKLDAIKNATNIMCYVSFDSEPDTHALIDKLCAGGKNLCVPLCDTKSFEMTACKIEGLSSLHPGAYGILEPISSETQKPEDIDCVIIPGAVFGRNFHRIGYGKGYYDKFLPMAKNAVKIGLCYDLFLKNKVDTEEFDVPLDIIVTEKEVLLR